MKKAFTLIELLVVIAIIAILAAILFPVFAQAKLAAKKTNDLSQNKQLGLSSLMYATDYDDTALSFPYAADWSTPAYTHGEKGLWWSDRLMPYVKNKGIFADQSNKDTLFYCDGYWRPGGNSATDTDPNHLYRVTYTYNEFISHADDNPDTPGAASFTAIPEVAATVLLGPSQNWFNRSSCQPNPGGTGASTYWDISIGGAGYELWGAVSSNDITKGGYTSGANFAFADGHAAYSKLTVGGDSVFGTNAQPWGTPYQGYFVKAKTHPNVAACNATYDPTKYDF